jgi:hypothetical protein
MMALEITFGTTRKMMLSRKERMAKEKQVKYEAELASRGPGVGSSTGAGDQFSVSQQTSKVSSMNLENAVDIKVNAFSIHIFTRLRKSWWPKSFQPPSFMSLSVL